MKINKILQVFLYLLSISIYSYSEPNKILTDLKSDVSREIVGAIKKCELCFSMWNGKFPTYLSSDILQLYISKNFHGLIKNNFERDSMAVENHKWSYLVEPKKISKRPITDIMDAKDYKIDITPYINSNFTIAIRYQINDMERKLRQPSIFFEDMKMVVTLNNGEKVYLSPAQWGFTPLNMKYKLGTSSSDPTLTGDFAYKTSRKNVGGYWNIVHLKEGNFRLWGEFAGEDRVKHYNWLISNPININALLQK